VSGMTIKEWAAAYRAVNEAEREELKIRLLQETIEQSLRSYFAWCELALAFSGSPDVPVELQEAREKHYNDLARKWMALLRRIKHVVQP
jgi:hypothetical protein